MVSRVTTYTISQTDLLLFQDEKCVKRPNKDNKVFSVQMLLWSVFADTLVWTNFMKWSKILNLCNAQRIISIMPV